MGFEVLLSSKQIQSRVRELGDEISKRYGERKSGDEVIVVGVLRGSFVFLADLVRAISTPTRIDFIEASSYGTETTSSGEVRILRDLRFSVQGKDVVIVEDIVDTGITLTALLKHLQGHKPKSLAVCSLLHKPARKVKEVPIDFLGFTIEDKFVVGYGLDFNERFRNLPNIEIYPGHD